MIKITVKYPFLHCPPISRVTTAFLTYSTFVNKNLPPRLSQFSRCCNPYPSFVKGGGTNYGQCSHFITPENTTFGFLVISGDIKSDHWPEMG